MFKTVGLPPVSVQLISGLAALLSRMTMSTFTTSARASGQHVPSFRFYMGLSVAVVFGVMTCHYYDGENASIRIHDCLDCTVAEYAVFPKNEAFFCQGNTIFEPELGGIPRNCLASECYLPALPYRYLTAFHAYVLNELVERLVALLGMALLLRGHVLRDGAAWLISGAACAFALLPFYPNGLGIAGQPLLFYAVLNLGAGKHKAASLFVVAFFPFFSNFVLVGFVLVGMLALYTVYRCANCAGSMAGWLPP